MKRKITTILQIAFVLVAFTAAGTAFAQANAGNAACGSDALEQLFCQTDIAGMLNTAFQLSIILGGVLAMLRIGYAGWLYMGRDFDNWSTKQHARQVFQDAIIGLLILLAIWLILNQINPDILKLRILQGDTSLPASQNSGGNAASGNNAGSQNGGNLQQANPGF